MAVIGAQTAAFSMAKPFVAGRTVLPMLRSSTTTTSLALSPATVGGLLTRGGASEVVLKSFYGDALGKLDDIWIIHCLIRLHSI